MRRIYLDFNASTPVAPEVAEAMRPYFEGCHGNPSSAHWAGIPEHEALEKARAQVADLLGCRPQEIVFTSGGTESNNHALKGVFFAKGGAGCHIITTQVEHPAVLNPCHFLERLGASVTYLPVDHYGRVDPQHVAHAVRPTTVLVSVMHANNEVGTIQPVEAAARIARERGILFHTDAAQTVGKTSVNVHDLGVDLLSVAGHKLHTPRGTGALYIRNGISIEPLIHGAGHESGRRAGTEKVMLDVALGVACDLARSWTGAGRLRELRDLFWNLLRNQFGEDVVLNGHPAERLPNTLNVSFPGRNGAEILARAPEIAASTGSACQTGCTDISPVLQAMQVPPHVAMGAIRFSLGRTTTREEIEEAAEILARAVR